MGLGYFKMTLHVGIMFRARSSPKVSKPSRWVIEGTMHVAIAFKVDSSFKLVIPAPLLTFTNYNFGA